MFSIGLAIGLSAGALVLPFGMFISMYQNNRAFCRIVRYWSRSNRFANKPVKVDLFVHHDQENQLRNAD